MKKFRRMNQHATLGGVCSGVAYHLGLQSWIVKAITVVLVLGAGIGVIPYILVALLAPQYEQDPDDYEAVCE